MNRQDNYRAYHAAHREERNAYSRAYRVTHKDEISAHSLAYRATHKDEISARRRARYREDRILHSAPPDHNRPASASGEVEVAGESRG